MAGDAVAVLDEAGIERAHVLGTSLGGMIALQLVLEHPDRVDKLVLACTTPGGAGAAPMPERTTRLLAEAQGLPAEVALRRFVENAFGLDPDPAQIERIMRHRIATAQAPAAWAAQASAGATFDVWERLGEIHAQTLVLTGDEDAVVDPKNSDILAARIPQARVETFAGGGHLFFWEQPDRFVALVEEFLL
jgi:pimeloyl-ACP methyl ester carboxylesterase